MQNRIFSLVRESCAHVAQNARHVFINRDAIEKCADRLPLEMAESPVMDAEHHLVGNDHELTLAYFFVLDCINFGSGYFVDLEAESEKAGYFDIAANLKNEFLRLEKCSPEWMQGLSAADCCRIFKQSGENENAMRLMQLFAQAVNEFGQFIAARFEGSFEKLIAAADNSAARLVENLIQMPFYRDVFTYHGTEVWLLKRAQITVSDINFAFNGKHYGRFEDIHELTIFADNLVPHVLLTEGLLTYSASLYDRIRVGKFLDSGSDEEVELRACAVHAVELMVQALQKSGRRFTSQQLDYMLWNLGQHKKYREFPVHRTLSVFY